MALPVGFAALQVGLHISIRGVGDHNYYNFFYLDLFSDNLFRFSHLTPSANCFYYIVNYYNCIQ